MTVVTLRERKRLATRERIIATAVKLFSARGIEAVTVDEIAAAAEIGKGTVYNYFAAKEDIVVAFLLELDRAALAEFPGFAAIPTAAEALDRAAWRLLEGKAGHHGFVRAFMARLFSGDPAFVTRDLAGFQAEMDSALGRLFAELQPRASAAALDELILAFKTMHLGLSALWAIEGPPFAAARRMTQLQTRLLAEGLLR